MNASANHMMVQPRSGSLTATVITGYDDSTGMETGESWVSADGVTWAQVESVFPPWTSEHEVDFGMVAIAMSPSTHLFWVSTDGSTWIQLEGSPGSHEPSGAGYAGAGAAGDILFTAVGNVGGSRTLWIGRFESSP